MSTPSSLGSTLYGDSLTSIPGKIWNFASADLDWHLTDTPERGSLKATSPNPSRLVREVTYKTNSRDITNTYNVLKACPSLVIEFLVRRIFGSFATGCAYVTAFPAGTAIKAVHSGMRGMKHFIGNRIYADRGFAIA